MEDPINYTEFNEITDVVILRDIIRFWQNLAIKNEMKIKEFNGTKGFDTVINNTNLDLIIDLMEKKNDQD